MRFRTTGLWLIAAIALPASGTDNSIGCTTMLQRGSVRNVDSGDCARDCIAKHSFHSVPRTPPRRAVSASIARPSPNESGHDREARRQRAFTAAHTGQVRQAGSVTYRHGFYTAEAIAERKAIRAWLRSIQRLQEP